MLQPLSSRLASCEVVGGTRSADYSLALGNTQMSGSVTWTHLTVTELYSISLKLFRAGSWADERTKTR